MSGWDYTRKANRNSLPVCEPPMPLVKIRDGGGLKEREPMNICQRVRDIFILSIDSANSIHGVEPLGGVFSLDRSSRKTIRNGRPVTDHFASMTLKPSQAAPTSPVTMTVITALKV